MEGIVEAVLDVFAKQPLPEDSELWGLPNVIITPRIAGITSQKWPAVLPAIKENLRRFIAGEPLRNLVQRVGLLTVAAMERREFQVVDLVVV